MRFKLPEQLKTYQHKLLRKVKYKVSKNYFIFTNSFLEIETSLDNNNQLKHTCSTNNPELNASPGKPQVQMSIKCMSDK